MMDYFFKVLEKEHPHYIISITTADHGELHAIQVKYCKAGKFYNAITFYTSIWIGPTLLSVPAIGTCKLKDIASIQVFSTKKVCDSFPQITGAALGSLVQSLERTIKKDLLPLIIVECAGDVVDIGLDLAPSPCITISVLNTNNLIGSGVVFANGSSVTLFQADTRFQDYLQRLSLVLSRAYSSAADFKDALPTTGGSVERLELF